MCHRRAPYLKDYTGVLLKSQRSSKEGRIFSDRLRLSLNTNWLPAKGFTSLQLTMPTTFTPHVNIAKNRPLTGRKNSNIWSIKSSTEVDDLKDSQARLNSCRSSRKLLKTLADTGIKSN